MIARTWDGATSAEDADAYLEYLRRTGVATCRSTPGNRGVYVLRSIAGDRAQFRFISLWDSMEAIRRFAGDTPERAVFFPEDDRYLVDRDEDVEHYWVAVHDGLD